MQPCWYDIWKYALIAKEGKKRRRKRKLQRANHIQQSSVDLKMFQSQKPARRRMKVNEVSRQQRLEALQPDLRAQWVTALCSARRVVGGLDPQLGGINREHQTGRAHWCQLEDEMPVNLLSLEVKPMPKAIEDSFCTAATKRKKRRGEQTVRSELMSNQTDK